MKKIFCSLTIFLICSFAFAQNKIVVFQTDFGLKDGAVSAMKGVAIGVDTTLKLFDLTHEIPAYNIWEAAYRLEQTMPYWPEGTVFVSVVDPGVGTNRKSVVVKTKTGKYIVGPDNGTYTLIAESQGIEAVREIDEATNRRLGSEKSYTFHGRDVYAFTAAKLASGKINFEAVGKAQSNEVVKIPYSKAAFKNYVDKDVIEGTIAILDIQYGNIWTNITTDVFDKLQPKIGDKFSVEIFYNNAKKYSGVMPYANTFGAVGNGKALLYLNSLMQVSFALNMGSFAQQYKISSGANWKVVIKKQ
jgi:S-adenosylmethionine hydrolase